MGYNFISEEDTARVFGLTVKGLRKQRYNGEGPAYHKAGKKSSTLKTILKHLLKTQELIQERQENVRNKRKRTVLNCSSKQS